MKRLFNWQVRLGIALVSVSAFVYYVHYRVFHDAHHIFLYLVGDLAFVFIEVLLVTIILHELLGMREKQQLLQKLNMVVGAFFSEVGLELLRAISAGDSRREEAGRMLKVAGSWRAKDFQAASRALAAGSGTISLDRISLPALKGFLGEKRDFLLRLLENPNLLEHESFTNLLWAVFHLTEELAYRSRLDGLTRNDAAHLAGDIQRAYELLLLEWLAYMTHLRRDYPYLFSLAVRTNPFDPDARVEVA
jgi:hypothetical protein